MMVRTPRGEFAVHETGRGSDTVLLLHPLATSGAIWTPLLAQRPERAEGRYRFLALDARGHGSSSWDGGPFTIEDLAQDTAAVLDALGVRRAAVVGMSMGGCTAIALAAERPDLVGPLALCDTTADYGPDRVAQWAERAHRARSVPRERQIEFQVDRWFSPDFRRASPDRVQLVCDAFVGTDSRAHAQACLAMGHFDGTDRLTGITAPTLVVVGAEDYATPPAMAQALADGIPGARLAGFDRVRHLSLLEHPPAWDAVTAHLAAHAPTDEGEPA